MNYKSLIPWTVFYLAITSVAILFLSGSHIPKISLMVLSLIAIYLNLETLKHENTFVALKDLFVPFLPWIISTIILACVHSFSGLSYFYNSCFLLVLIFLALSPIPVQRHHLLWACGLLLLATSFLISFYVLNNQLGSNIFGVNKNKVLYVTALLSVCCLSSYISGYQTLGKPLKSVLLASVALSLVSIVLSEVRLVFLAYLSFIFLLVAYPRKEFRKFIVLSVFIFLLLIVFSLLTGRLQQGFDNLAQFQAGNSNTSWGIRLELWDLALRAFVEKPLFGWGDDPYHAITAAGIEFGVPALPSPHFHSDMMHSLAYGGIIGFVGLIATYTVLCWQSRKDFTRLAVIIAMISMGLVDRFWAHWITLYPFILLWLLLYVTAPDQKEKNNESQHHCSGI